MGEPRRVLVTGSRFLPQPGPVWDALDEQLEHADGAGVVVVHGDCSSGADAFARVWVQRRGQQEERHPADWDTCTGACTHGPAVRWDGTPYCPVAGPRRNQEMVDAGADIVLAFPRLSGASRGTMGLVRMAQAAGLPVRLFTHP